MNFIRTILSRSWGVRSRPVKPVSLVLRGLLILVMLTAIAPQQVFSKENSAMLPTWKKYSVDAPRYFTNMTDRSLAFNPTTNQPCIAYGGDALYYSCFNRTIDGWRTTILDHDTQVGEWAALAFNSYGWPFITYYDSLNAKLRLVYYNRNWGTWVYLQVPNVDGFNAAPEAALQPAAPESAVTRDLEAPEGALPMPEFKPPTESIARVPSDNEPVDKEELLQVAPAETDEPGILEKIQEVLATVEQALAPDFPFISEGYGKYSSIDVDNLNNVHISYHDEIDGSLEYVYWNGISWNGKVVDDYNDQGDTGLWSSIKVDEDRNVNVAYMCEKYDNLMYARRKSTGGWEITTVDGIEANYDVGSFSSIALDINSRPHISYYDFSGDRLKHAWRDKNKVWHKEVVDSTDKITGWWTSIAIDPDNRIHISYYNVQKGDLRYARYNGSNWSIKTLDGSGSNQQVGLFTSIAIDTLGRPGIAYVNKTFGGLRYIYSPKETRWNAPQWVSLAMRDVGQATSIAIDSTGVPYVSYLDASSGYLKFARTFGLSWKHRNLITSPASGLYSSIAVFNGQPRVAYYEQTNRDLMYARSITSDIWRLSTVDKTFDVGKYVSLAMDSGGKPHISYYDTTNQELAYAELDIFGTGWVTQTIDSIGNVGLYTSIAVDADKNPWISYYDATQGALRLAYRSPINSWVKVVIDYIGMLGPTGVGASSSIAIDGAGRPHITYYDVTNKMLKHATWDGISDPDISVIDSAQDTGRYNSLAIHSLGGVDTLHVCYYDYTNGDLKYAQSTGLGWDLQVVDGAVGLDGDSVNEGDVGQYCDIALNADGQPVISYYANSKGDLKVAMSYAPPPAEVFLPLAVLP